MAIEHVTAVLACWPVLSVTVTVKVYEPGVLGVPVSRPAAERLNPGGSDPDETDQE